jgi:LuxR family maltose regulon positive regulatory protein
VASTNPKLQNGLLKLSENRQIAPGSAEWSDWLEQHQSFYFEDEAGSFSARKESRAGGLYWYGYRRRQRKLHSAYLGKSEELTLARLKEVATILAGQTSTVSAVAPVRVEPETNETVPLVTTKLYIPSPRPTLVARSRLIERLDWALRYHKLTVLSASPGFGKTTLLSEWIEQKQVLTAWLSLDELDNDPARFLAYCLAALDTIQPNISRPAQKQLKVSFSHPASLAASNSTAAWEGIVTTLVNTLSALKLPRFAFVLDDYHFITAPTVQKIVAFLLEHLPPSMHLIITSRTEVTNLPLTRLRARDQLTELGSTELRFTPKEVTAFLNSTMNLNLSSQEVERLTERTEGWITGIQLTALSLQKRNNGSRDFLKDLAVTPRFILDYLTEEVLEQQSEPVRQFLLETSILDRLNGELCKVVTGQNNGQKMLEYLEQANLFLVALDDEQCWYRYHQLFADFLRNRLNKTAGEQVIELHRRAAGWFEQQGLTAEAIQHSFVAGNFEKAANLLEQIAQSMLMRGELTTLRDWLGMLPEASFEKRADLSLYYASVLTLRGEVQSAEDWLVRLEQKELAPEQQRQLKILRGLVAALRVDLSQFEHFVNTKPEPLESALGTNRFWNSFDALNRALAHDIRGETEAASRAYQEATSLSQNSGNLLVELFALSQVGDTQVTQGQLQEAVANYRLALELVKATPELIQPQVIVNVVHLGLSRVLYEWDQLEEAVYHIQEAAKTRSGADDLLTIVQSGSYAVQAKIYWTQGKFEDAQQTMKEAIRLCQHTELTWLREFVQSYEAVLNLSLGNIAAAEQWANRYRQRTSQPEPGQDISGNILTLRELQDAIFARVLLAQGDLTEALEILEPLRQTAEEGGRNGTVIEALLLKALTLEARGQTTEALNALERALFLAEPAGYIRLFIDEGAPMAALLLKLSQQPSKTNNSAQPSPAYLAKLLSYFNPAITAPTPELETPETQIAKHQPSIPGETKIVNRKSEIVNSRELEILRLVEAGLSNQEIARRLVVTVNTVKWHLYHLYEKLEVRNRGQAVARARELGLL